MIPAAFKSVVEINSIRYLEAVNSKPLLNAPLREEDNEWGFAYFSLKFSEKSFASLVKIGL